MRAKYLFKLKEPVRFEDHWPIPVMAGELRIISQDGMATALEVTFTGQPVSLSPKMEQHEAGDLKLTIIDRDTLLPFVRTQLENAFTFLQCYFDVEVLIGEIEIEYAGESEEEKGQIDVRESNVTREKRPLPLPFDLLTRAIMAAETEQAPEFEATLVSAARSALVQERYIDSFRYAFLLIESLYGDGQFKVAQLKRALKKSAEFTSLVAIALNSCQSPKRPQNSDTEKLLATSPTTEAVIDHLVEMRGFYFHGNVKRKDAWRPHEQQTAEMLALLSVEIVLSISHAAAAPVFDEKFSQRHFDDAKRVGATMTMNVGFRFREPGEDLDRDENMRVTVPGTKVTPKMAVYVAKEFLDRFQSVTPVADLKSAVCTVQETGQKVFDFNVHVDDQTQDNEDASSER